MYFYGKKEKMCWLSWIKLIDNFRNSFFLFLQFILVWCGLCKHNEAIQQKQTKDPYYYNEYNTINNRLEVAHMIHQLFLDF